MLEIERELRNVYILMTFGFPFLNFLVENKQKFSLALLFVDEQSFPLIDEPQTT